MKGLFSKSKLPKKAGIKEQFVFVYKDNQYEIDGASHFSKSGKRLVLEQNESVVFSLFLNGDVLSLVPKQDLKLNAKDIIANRMYILESGDSIVFEDDEVVVEKVKIEQEVTAPDIPQMDSKAYIQDEATKEFSLDDIENELLDEAPIEKVKKPSSFSLKVPNKKEKKKKEKKAKKDKKKRAKKVKSKVVIEESAKSLNALYRIIAIVFELLMVYIIFEFIEIDRALIGYDQIFNGFEIDLDFEGLKLTESILYSIADFALVFGLLRILGSILFKVSPGQLLLGVKHVCYLDRSRILSFIREILGFITGPALIFDLPALISKKTLKEWLTRTSLESAGFLKSFVLFLLNMTLLLSLLMVSPYFSIKNIGVNKNVEGLIRPMKSRGIKNKEQVFQGSSLLGLMIPSDLPIFVKYRFKRNSGKLSLNPVLDIKTSDGAIELKLDKSFSFKDLLSLSSKGNILFGQKYPYIKDRVIADNTIDESLKSKFDRARFENEVLDLTRTSMALNVETFYESILNQNVFIKGQLLYRKKLNELIGLDSKTIEVKSHGGKSFFIVDHKMERTYLEISENKSNVYNVKGLTKAIRKQLRKLNFMYDESKIEFSFLSILDTLSKDELNDFSFQESYEYAFSYMKNALELGDLEYKDDLVESLSSQIKFVDMKAKRVEDRNLYDKYIQNLSDAIRAFKEEDKEYFGIGSGISSL